MAEKVFFKIVIPNYNNMAYIKQCLDSVLSQTFQDFKIILVDDQSADMSYEFAKMYERKYPDKLIVVQAEEKRYAGGCRNIGIDYPLDCEYCYFMDSDDYLYSDKSLQTIYSALADSPDMLLFNWVQDINGSLMRHRKMKFSEKTDQLANTLWSAGWTRVTKKDVTSKFLENCMRAEDTYQFLSILDKLPSVKQIDDIIYVYRFNRNGAIYSENFKKHRPIYINALKELKKTCVNEYVRKSIDRRIGL